MGKIRIRHPEVEVEGTAVSLAQFEKVHKPRGWELVPEGTPHPDAVAAEPVLEQVAKFKDAQQGVGDDGYDVGRTEPAPIDEVEGEAKTSAEPDTAAKPKRRRSTAASTDAAEDPAASEENPQP